MQLVESHVIKPNHEHYAEIDAAAFASKNLYNLATYHQRQRFFASEFVYSYVDLYNLLKSDEAYKALPAKVAQQTLRLVDKAWKGHSEALKVWKVSPEKFLGEPRIPGYQHKESGRFPLVYTIQSIGKKLLRGGLVKPSGLNITVKTRQKDINQVRIVPKKTHYVLEVVYSVEPESVDLDNSLVAGLDLGLNNLCAISSNKRGFTPLVVNGRPLKSINQFYNKRKAELQSILGSDKATSKRIDRMTDKRNRQIDHYMHSASKRVIDHLVNEGIGTLIIGLNDEWKQGITIGKRNNQNFVQIPHARFVHMLTYKAELVGIKVITTEESYTSKTSFLDNEEPCKQSPYAGRRIKRGLFRSSSGCKINADVNGAYQIIKKVISDAFTGREIEDAVVHPLPLHVAVA